MTTPSPSIRVLGRAAETGGEPGGDPRGVPAPDHVSNRGASVVVVVEIAAGAEEGRRPLAATIDRPWREELIARDRQMLEKTFCTSRASPSSLSELPTGCGPSEEQEAVALDERELAGLLGSRAPTGLGEVLELEEEG